MISVSDEKRVCVVKSASTNLLCILKKIKAAKEKDLFRRIEEGKERRVQQAKGNRHFFSFFSSILIMKARCALIDTMKLLVWEGWD